ncbi:class C beta-lactamase-related serine hydrolase [Nocardioides guangzhouensis]|uniref:Class C beta-lactamase-related serine hydrolase n=1 Tax=Nocardioides guangzhouensis TaxID=2497878 RepID=A0A4V1XY61_9ACTN|nr:serine hydrolase [Nocardioides guangzhouensis]RYP82129.1 class C beta-lactamase-related serine hydrolase [Nocardioides guangzhouensis]
MSDATTPTRYARVSAANWLEAPYNRWSMWHVREISPTKVVSHGAGPALPLPDRAQPLDLDRVEVARVDGSVGTVRDVLDDTFTDAFAVLQDGEVADEWYAEGGGPDLVHAVLSVTKSLVGCVAGILLDRGVLDEDAPVEQYVPELAPSGYAGASVRHLLDMRSGALFLEDYTDPIGGIRQLGEWLLGEQGLYAFLPTLGAERPHGGHFLYRSSETDVLGWVCERASGSLMADLIGELVWAPMGASDDAEIMVDRTGTAVHDGGLSATARDLLRFGQLLLTGGSVPDPEGGVREVLPPRWLRQAWAVDADVRSAFVESPAEQTFPGGWYRNQFWFRVGEYGDVLLCMGIHGQLVYVSRRTRTVCVKLSSWPDAQNPAYLQDTLRACDAVSGALTRQTPTGDIHRLPGVVSGLSRGGTARRPGPSVI